MSSDRSEVSEKALSPYRDWPVGRPPEPDLSAMTKEQIEERRETVARLRELTRKAEKGTKNVVPEIREILQANPDLAWRLMDFARLAEWHYIERMSKEKDLAAKELLAQQLSDMRAEIAGENPSPLERLLAERVVATWFQVQFFEGLYAMTMSNGTTLAQASYAQKRLDQTYRRHLSAIRTLAQVRKMGPAVQINIADKQINQAG